jgi:hypothetical protein
VFFDLAWFPMANWKSWDKYMSRWGTELSFRYYPQSANNNRSVESMFYSGTLLYRLNKKWALGAGYSLFNYRLDFSKNSLPGYSSIVNEKTHNYYVRLELIPYLYEERR